MAETLTYQSQSTKNGKLFFSISGTYTNVGTSQETVIQFPSNIRKKVWSLSSTHFNRTGGSAANYQFSIGDTTGFSTGTGNELLLGSSEAVATATHDTYVSPIPMWIDSNFQLFFKPGFDASADNDGTFELIFETE